MAKLRLLIKQPERADTCIPVTVEETEIIGTCLSSLVDHLGLPRRDALGRVLTYALRPLSGGQPLLATKRFVDVHVLAGTRLVLDADELSAVTQPMSASRLSSDSSAVPGAAPSRQRVSRRTFVVGGVLTGCALSGLSTGMATAFATRRRALPGTMTPPTPQTPAPLQQSLLFSAHQYTVRALSWSPDGTLLASGGDDGMLLLWSPDGQVQQRIPHPAGIAALAWSPSGTLLASGSGRSLRFFDGRTALPVAPARSMHTGQVTSLSWSSAEGHPLVSGSLDRHAIVWDTHALEPRAVFTHHTSAINALFCQPKSPLVASASQGGAVRLWRVDTLTEAHGFYQDAPRPLRAVAFAPTGHPLAVGGEDGGVRFWDNAELCHHSTITAQGILCVDVPQRFRAQTAPVRSLSWSADARSLATGAADGTLAIWAVTPGAFPALAAKMVFAEAIQSVAWSPVREQLAVASGSTVTIWDRGK